MVYHALSEKQLGQIHSKLEAYLPIKCRICNEEVNSISNITGKLVEAKANDTVHNLDTVNLICTNCGHLELFSAETLGVKFN